MSKIDEARKILEALGLPPAQRNDIACFTLLSLAGIPEGKPWKAASRHSVTIHQMLGCMKGLYGKEYAENTREAVRRQVIHQFEQARLVDRNPDSPGLATNSPLTHYALTTQALAVIRSYGTSRWEKAVSSFISRQGTLLEAYLRSKRLRQIPVRTPTGEIVLSPGQHNLLEALVVSSFGSRFAPGGRLLYLGDAAGKWVYVDQERLTSLHVPFTEHDKLPDVMFYCEKQQTLILVEAVTSHGPVSPKRLAELEALMVLCAARRIYVSAFADFKEFKRHTQAIAWETDVWIAEMPDHLIHYNGDKFLSLHSY